MAKQTKSKKHVVQKGQLKFTDADDANIPVNIFLSLKEDNCDDCGHVRGWELSADNFQPRRAYVEQNAWEFYCEDRATLVALVQKHWKPLYAVALKLIDLKPDPSDERGNAALYYWELP